MLLLAGLIGLFIAATAGFQAPSGGLPPRYQKWLDEEVVYIISPVEKKVFQALGTDRERDVFIEAFWRQRNPGGLIDGRNGFKDEHYRRIEHATREFGRTSAVPGWKTDRGRIYVTLGPPSSIDRYNNVFSVFPIEIWNYQRMSKYGLPDVFSLVFFRKHGAGDFRLYSPGEDGPQSLMETRAGRFVDADEAYAELREINARIADLSLSLIPGSAMDGASALSSDILLLSIPKAPLALVKDEYAGKFLSHKGIVEVEYSANYIENEALVHVLLDESGMSCVHYLIELDRLSVLKTGDRYATRLVLNGKVADETGRPVHQFEKTIPLQLDAGQLEQVWRQKCAIQDFFPLIEGRFSFSLLVKNEASKEFTTFEREIVVPAGQRPGLNRMLLAYGKDVAVRRGGADALSPYSIGGVRYSPAPRGDFAAEDTLIVLFQTCGLSEELKRTVTCSVGVYRKKDLVLEQRIDLGGSGRRISFAPEFPLSGLAPDYYQVRVSLRDGTGQEIAGDEAPFFIAPTVDLPRPWTSSTMMPSSSDPLHLTILGNQYLSQGEIEKARPLLAKSLEMDPGSTQAALGYGHVLFGLKDYRSVVRLLTPFSENGRSEVLELLGRSCQALGDFQQAAAFYQTFLSRFGSHYRIFVLLGDCFLQLGRTDEAVKSWEKSLEINPNQEEVKQRLASLRR